jgi:hypothetical protein
MLPHAMFSLTSGRVLQVLAFVVFAGFTIGFFAWVVRLVREK